MPNHTSLLIFLARKSQEHFGIHFNKDTNVEFESKANQDATRPVAISHASLLYKVVFLAFYRGRARFNLGSTWYKTTFQSQLWENLRVVRILCG